MPGFVFGDSILGKYLILSWHDACVSGCRNTYFFFMIVYVVLVLVFSILSVSEFSVFACLRRFDSRDVQRVIMEKSKSLLADGNRP